MPGETEYATVNTLTQSNEYTQVQVLIDMQNKRNSLFKKRKVRHEKVLITQIQV